MTEQKLPEIGNKYRYTGKFESVKGIWEVVALPSVYSANPFIKLKKIGTNATALYLPEDFPCDALEEIPNNSQPEESKPNAVEDALEAEKSVVNSTIPQKPISSIVENTRACEHGDKYPYDFNNGDEVEKRCYACAQEGMAEEKHTSKTHQLDENTPAKSIWKPVSELPKIIKDYFICFIKFHSGEIRLGEYDCGEFYTKDAKAFLKCEMESYAAITDFINEHIDMKERLERLENNNKK